MCLYKSNTSELDIMIRMVNFINKSTIYMMEGIINICDYETCLGLFGPLLEDLLIAFGLPIDLKTL